MQLIPLDNDVSEENT